MSNYRMRFDLVPTLPDDHLVTVRWTDNEIIQEFREGFAHPEWLYDYGEFLRHLTNSGIMRMTPELINDEPDWDLDWQIVPKDFMPMQCFGVRRELVNGREKFTFLHREGMLKKEIVKEMVDWHLPRTGGLIRYKPGIFDNLRGV